MYLWGIWLWRLFALFGGASQYTEEELAIAEAAAKAAIEAYRKGLNKGK